MFIAHLITEIANPMDGVVPNFSVFGVEFNTWWKQLLGGAWALALVAAIAYVVRGFVSMNQHQSGGHPSQMRESRSELKTALIALGGLAALPVIVGAVLAVAG